MNSAELAAPRRVHLYACSVHGIIATPRKLSRCVVCGSSVNRAHAGDMRLPLGDVVDRYRKAFYREENKQREIRKRKAARIDKEMEW